MTEYEWDTKNKGGGEAGKKGEEKADEDAAGGGQGDS